MADAALDARVRTFLDRHAGDRHDMHVPESDGKILHDLVLESGFTIRRACSGGAAARLPTRQVP